MAAPKKQRPLIRYAGSAAETSIGSKPIGSELSARVYPEQHISQADLVSSRTPAHLPELPQPGEPGGWSIYVTLCPDAISGVERCTHLSRSRGPNASLCRVEEGTYHAVNRRFR